MILIILPGIGSYISEYSIVHTPVFRNVQELNDVR